MGYDLTVQGLIRKRSEMASEAAGLKEQLGARLSDLDALDRVIRIFKPDIDLADLPERPAPLALSGTRGEFQRFLLDQLRKANHPLTTFELAERVMHQRGLDLSDRVLLSLIRKRTGCGLAKLRKNGKATSNRAHGSAPLEWELTGATVPRPLR
jgi:hypothetical protein